MLIYLSAILLLLAGGSISLFYQGRCRSSIGAISACVGSLIIFLTSLKGLISVSHDELSILWQIPFGRFHIAEDGLTQLFALPIGLIGAIGAVCGYKYLRADSLKGRNTGWFLYNLLLASMTLLVLARNGVLFLITWELMVFSSFFLVIYEHKKPGVLKSGWIYLVSSQLGTAFILGVFCLLDHTGDMEFSHFSAHGKMMSIVFLLAVVGFGTKAGLVPFHVWLPAAYPVAPSHVAALMSGVMVKLGVYGLLRILVICNGSELWWSYLLIILGAISCLYGVLYAAHQNHLKRLLAYSSSENIGIILLGIGLGVLGLNTKNDVLAVLAFSGALLHTINHSIFKSLLFLSAGSVCDATGTSDIDKLGGLMKKMPLTALSFAAGCAGICAIPTFNGFISEFLIYSASFHEIVTSDHWIWAGICIGSLALTGGLAAFCFSKAFGIVFAGLPRSQSAINVHESHPLITVSMLILAALAFGIGMTGPWVVKLIQPAIAVVVKLPDSSVTNNLSTDVLWTITSVSLVFIVIIVVLCLLRCLQQKKQSVRFGPTWDCGYNNVSPRMQYTSTSFVQPLKEMFCFVIKSSESIKRVTGLFPEKTNYRSSIEEPFINYFYRPIFKGIRFFASRCRIIQQGHTHIYVLYIALTLLILLLWKLWS